MAGNTKTVKRHTIIISVGLLMLACFLLTGCSKKETGYLLGFSSSAALSSVEMEDAPETLPLFAEDLCVIPADGEGTEADDTIKAAAAMLVHVEDGEALYASHAFDRLYPASITKLGTAYMALKYGNLSDIVTISYNASHITEPGAKLCRFKEGDKIDLKTLLTVLLVYSGNDAGIAVAEHISGTEEAFCEQMNEELKALGAVDTHFTNSHGLHSDDHYTTAYDIYLIFNELLKYDLFTDIIQTSLVHASYKDSSGKTVEREFETTNRYFLRTTKAPEGITVLGGKTGTTDKAGSCLIVYSKDQDRNHYISLLLREPTNDMLYSQMTYLLEKTASQ
ncbi:D-alanyl-D-alanine carboxypeptidase [Anaerolentibacter hominis]|uniref:D-alanyl-D-alanine carboxypeptidase family protein n=1 Tax=Anaerolentibacter hominis TaxID=3079009 RepID=UPI0031B7F4A8